MGHIFFVRHTCYVVRGRILGILLGRANHIAVLWCCMWGRGPRVNNALVRLLAGFQSLPFFPKTKLDPSGADSQVGGFVCILGPCGSLQLSCEAGSFSCHCSPPQVFSVRGFEALFPYAGTLGCVVCLAPQLFLLVFLHANVGPPTPPVTASSPTVFFSQGY